MLTKTMSEVDVKLGLRNVLTKIEQASKRRKPELQDVTPRLVAVSKTKPPGMIIEAYEAGQRHFGENYVNELEDKANHADILEKCKDIRWHFIGNLQSNKVNKLLILPNLYMIETLDDEKLATKLNTNWPKFNFLDTKLNVMIQVNTSGEEGAIWFCSLQIIQLIYIFLAKNGVSPSSIINLAKHIKDNCPNLSLHGLMTIGQFGYDLSQGPNPDFLLLKKCKDDVCKELNIDWKDLHLSMGMSDDFEHAIELGSTNVRVGSSIFGYRAKNV